MVPPTTAEVCWPLELGVVADEVCLIHGEDISLELAMAVVVVVASVPRMEGTKVSDGVLLVEK
jgi:hypothetical protein